MCESSICSELKVVMHCGCGQTQLWQMFLKLCGFTKIFNKVSWILWVPCQFQKIRCLWQRFVKWWWSWYNLPSVGSKVWNLLFWIWLGIHQDQPMNSRDYSGLSELPKNWFAKCWESMRSFWLFRKNGCSWEPIILLLFHGWYRSSPDHKTAKKNSRWGSKHLLGSLLAHVFSSVCFPAFPASGYVRPVRPPLSTVLVERPHCQTRFSRAGILLSSLVQRSYHVTILGFAGIGSLFFFQLSVSSHWNRSTT